MNQKSEPELTLPPIHLSEILEKIILAGIVFILALPLLGDYGMWLFPVGRDVIFKLTVEFLLILAFVKSTFYNPSQSPSPRLRESEAGLALKGGAPPLILSLMFFWLVMVLAAIFSVQQDFSLWGNIYKNQGLVTWTHYLLFFFLLIGFGGDKKHWQFLIHSAIFVGTLVGLIALWQVLQNGFDSRAVSTLNNSNYLAAYLVLLLPITFAFFLRNKSLVLGSAAAIQLLALIAAQARGGYLGIAVAIFIFALLYTRRKKILVLPVLAIVAWLLIAITPLGQSLEQKLPNFIDRFLNYQNILNDSSPRLEAWRAGWQGMRARPLLGYGPENFFVAFDEHYSGSQDHVGSLAEEGSLWESWFDKAHNFIFDIGATMGFLGLFAYIMIFASAVWVLAKRARIMNYESRIMSIGLTSLFSGYLTQNLLGFDTIVPGIYLMFLLGYTNFIIGGNPSQSPLTLRGGAPSLHVREGWGKLSSRIFLICVILAVILLFIFSFKLHSNILKANHQLNLVEALARAGQIDKAFEAFEKGLAYNASPINPNLRRRYAVIALAYYDAVEKRCNPKLTGSDPVNLKKCENLFADSKKYLSRALELQQENAAAEWPRFTRNYIYAAQISHILGNYNNSDLYFAKALELSPNRASINKEWARLLEKRVK